MTGYEQIEAYLQGEMNDAERLQFEQQLKADVELKSMLRVYEQGHVFMQHEQQLNLGESALRSTITEAIAEQKVVATVPVKVVPILRKWLYGITAAAATVTLMMLLKITFFTKEPDAAILYSQYAVFENLAVINRGSIDAADSLLQVGVVLFNKKDYAGAIPVLNQYDLLKPGQVKYQLAKAYSLMQTGEYAAAETDFKTIEAGASVYKYQAIWYRALSLLKQQKITECKNVLVTIPAAADMYQQANKLLAELK